MKKLLCGIAIALVMVLATSCNQKKNVVVEEEVVEAVDTTAVVAPVDSLQVAE